jgi:hypothetical protein
MNGNIGNEAIFNNNGEIYRPRGRPPKIKIRGKEFLFFCSAGHAYELIAQNGDCVLYCPICGEKRFGTGRAGVELRHVSSAKIGFLPGGARV